MRFVSGIIVGCLLTIGVAYVHDAGQPGATAPSSETAAGDGRMVNWEVVNHSISGVSGWLQAQWAWLNEHINRAG